MTMLEQAGGYSQELPVPRVLRKEFRDLAIACVTDRLCWILETEGPAVCWEGSHMTVVTGPRVAISFYDVMQQQQPPGNPADAIKEVLSTISSAAERVAQEFVNVTHMLPGSVVVALAAPRTDDLLVGWQRSEPAELWVQARVGIAALTDKNVAKEGPTLSAWLVHAALRAFSDLELIRKDGRPGGVTA